MADSDPAASPDAAVNRALWTQINARYGDDHAYRAWTAEDITWGIFNVPEQQLGVLGDVDGLEVAELGCGTAYFRRGWPGGGHGRSASTSPPPSSAPPAGAKT